MLRDDTRIFRLSPNTELISTKTSQLFMLHIEFSSDCHSISMINGLVISLDNKQIVWCLVHNMQSCFSALRFISTVISLNEGISIIFEVHVNRNTRNCIGQEKWANVNTARFVRPWTKVIHVYSYASSSCQFNVVFQLTSFFAFDCV